jgi:hypothetical protein
MSLGTPPVQRVGRLEKGPAVAEAGSEVRVVQPGLQEGSELIPVLCGELRHLIRTPGDHRRKVRISEHAETRRDLRDESAVGGRVSGLGGRATRSLGAAPGRLC